MWKIIKSQWVRKQTQLWHSFQLTESKRNIVHLLLTALTLFWSSTVSKATGCSGASPWRLEGHKGVRVDGTNCTWKPSCLWIISHNHSQVLICFLNQKYFHFWLEPCLPHLFNILHSGVLISSSNNADPGTTLFTGTGLLAQCESWHSLTFHAFVECPFCPCQCCSIDDQDNYKPVNHRLAHETHPRSSWDLSHEYCMCISVTMLKLLCTNITAGELFWHRPVIFLTVIFFSFLFWHLFHSGIHPQARKLGVEGGWANERQ